MEFNWVNGFSIKVSIDGDSVVVSANREGLLSLANHLTALAQEEGNSHFHLDSYNALEDGSAELIVEKTESPEEENLGEH
ncbi:MAG: hypothetical protein IJI05_01150 [Erysipelotrichaceae bacterium]|nr:hypothetical protein [Erysipelotrichaceae bacterium]